MNNYRGEDIFNQYVKNLNEKGLIRQAQRSDEVKALTEEDKLKDSQYKETIELLYGVKPNGKDDDVLDRAHPVPVIGGPSYDRINGLVENLKEQQDIDIGKIFQPQRAKLTQTRYAIELQNQLLSLGHLLDQQEGSEDLVRLADGCADRINKEAIAWIPIAVGIAAVMGFAALVNHLGNHSDIIRDCDSALSALDEALPLVPTISSQMNELKESIIYMEGLVKDILGTNIDSKNLSNVLREEKVKEIAAKINHYKKAANILSTSISSTFIPLISTQRTKNPSTSDFWEGLKDVYHYFIPDEQNNLSKSLEHLATSLQDSIKEMDARQSAINNYVNSNQDKLLQQLQTESGPSELPKEKQKDSTESLMDQLKDSIPSKPNKPNLPPAPGDVKV